MDEAAQLKECEAAIPLQLSSIHRAILTGDESQLPAVVQSKVSIHSFSRLNFMFIVSSLNHREYFNGSLTLYNFRLTSLKSVTAQVHSKPILSFLNFSLLGFPSMFLKSL